MGKIALREPRTAFGRASRRSCSRCRACPRAPGSAIL